MEPVLHPSAESIVDHMLPNEQPHHSLLSDNCRHGECIRQHICSRVNWLLRASYAIYPSKT